MLLYLDGELKVVFLLVAAFFHHHDKIVLPKVFMVATLAALLAFGQLIFRECLHCLGKFLALLRFFLFGESLRNWGSFGSLAPSFWNVSLWVTKYGHYICLQARIVGEFKLRFVAENND